MVYVVYDDAVGDPIVDVLLKEPISGVESIALSEFLGLCQVRVDPDLALLSEPSGQMHHVIDRVVEISSQTILRIGGGVDITRGQVFSVYESILATGVPLEPSRKYCSMGQLFPLPTQWELLRQSYPDLLFPQYIYGYGPENIDPSECVDPIFKSPFDLYSWRPNCRPEGNVWDEFVVSRPRGRPIISYRVGSSTIVESLDGDGIDSVLKALLTDLTKRVLQSFSASIGEVLWFAEEGRVVFAAFSMFLAGAAKSPKFAGVARAYVNDQVRA
jgi:hypothetical protein